MLSETQLQQDLTAAMKARAMEEVYVLRGLVAAIKNLKVEKQVKELSEAELSALVRKEINKREEAIGFATKGGRTELVAENERQKLILERYLPKQLSPDELEAIIRQISAELGTSGIGPIMAALRERHAGQFDGKVASQIIRGLG